MGIYLDYNATTPINSDVLDEMIYVYKNVVGNADSRTHDYGDAAREVVESSRKKVADLFGVNSDEVFFTSGATESNNIAIQGLKEYANNTGKKHIITTSIEHKAVLETIKHLEKEGFEVDYINPGINGRVDYKEIFSKMREDTLLISVMHVNNETGIIQPIIEIGKEAEKRNILFHVDATQSSGKLVDELRKCKYNMLSCSAHKFYGPQGIGALILKKKDYKLPPITPIMFGGQQEHGISPGTIPVALVAGFGKACEIAMDRHEENELSYKKIHSMILGLLENSKLKYHVNGDVKYCIPCTLNICIEGVSSEALMLSSKQYCGISNGSACTSKSYAHSYVLKAMGLSEDEMDSSIRISWGADEDPEMIKENIIHMINVAKELVF